MLKSGTELNVEADARRTTNPVRERVREAGVSMPAVEVQDVSVTFPKPDGDLEVLGSTSLSVERGKFVAIVGPSGCGKSTLLSLIAGICRPTTGRVLLDGSEVEGIQSEVGFIFQDDLLLPWKKIRSNVELSLQMRGMSSKERRVVSDQWLTLVGLDGFGEYYPHELSGGMRKRAALAQGLIHEPSVLLLDEPFSALDVITRNNIENSFLALCERIDATTIFITHDLEEAIALADEVIVMSSRPSRVKAKFTVDLPRPREVNEVRHTEQFIELHREMWHELRSEVLK